MDVKTECEALETKLGNFCRPQIYINPDLYQDSEAKMFEALVKKIIGCAPVEAHELMLNENVLTPLQHYTDQEFYSCLFQFITRNQKLVAQKTFYTLLPYDQWKKKAFSAMKLRIVAVFVDILKSKVNNIYRSQVNQSKTSVSIWGSLTNAAKQENNGQQDIKTISQEDQKIVERSTAQTVENENKILQLLLGLDKKVDMLSAKVDTLETTMRMIAVRVIK